MSTIDHSLWLKRYFTIYVSYYQLSYVVLNYLKDLEIAVKEVLLLVIPLSLQKMWDQDPKPRSSSESVSPSITSRGQKNLVIIETLTFLCFVFLRDCTEADFYFGLYRWFLLNHRVVWITGEISLAVTTLRHSIQYMVLTELRNHSKRNLNKTHDRISIIKCEGHYNFHFKTRCLKGRPLMSYHRSFYVLCMCSYSSSVYFKFSLCYYVLLFVCWVECCPSLMEASSYHCLFW